MDSQGPNFQEDFSDDLLLGNAAYDGAAAVDGSRPVVTQHKIVALRHLIGKFDAAFPQSFFVYIGLLQEFSIDTDIALGIHRHNISREGHNPL